MSHEVNTQLLEEAAEMIDYFTSNPGGLDKLLIAAMENQDYDALLQYVKVGRDLQFQLEYNPNEVY